MIRSEKEREGEGGEEDGKQQEEEESVEKKEEEPYTFNLLAGIRYPDMRVKHTVVPDDWTCTRVLYQLRDLLFHTPDFSFLHALFKLPQEYTLDDLFTGIQRIAGPYESAEKYDMLLKQVEEQIHLFGERYRERYSSYRTIHWYCYPQRDALKPTALCIYAFLLIPLGCIPIASGLANEAYFYNREDHSLDALLRYTEEHISLACYLAPHY